MANSFSRYDVYAVAGSRYCYPDTNVLKNRFGLRDAAQLKNIEADISAVRQNDLLEHPIAGSFTAAHLCVIHRYISYIRLFPRFITGRSTKYGKRPERQRMRKGAVTAERYKKYSARYVTMRGKRIEKYFDTLPEARNWLADARYEDTHCGFGPTSTMTVDKWFDYWHNNIICDLSPNTKRNYKERYEKNIKSVIGRMCIVDVKPMHCKKILNDMMGAYAGSTIRQVYIAMGTMFRSAVMNDIISKHPMDGVRYTKPVRAASDHRVLTIEEQAKFLEAAQLSHNYRQYALILETGLRTGELIGLTWDAIDWENRTLTVNKTMEFRHNQHEWRADRPRPKPAIEPYR